MFSLRTTLGHICSITENNPERFYQDIELQNIVKHQVPYLLAQALMSTEAHNIKATANTKGKTIKTVIDYIQSLPNKDISIEMICSDTGINIRTLQRAFLEKYGVTPKSYLQSQRLNEAYKALLDSDPKTAKIRDIALSQGYWHMSQFAADYRRQFGELPSKTLAQHR